MSANGYSQICVFFSGVIGFAEWFRSTQGFPLRDIESVSAAILPPSLCQPESGLRVLHKCKRNLAVAVFYY